MRLLQCDFAALQRAIVGLYSFRNLAAFKRAIPTIFLGIIPADCFLLFDSRPDPETGRPTVVDLWESPPRLAADRIARGACGGSDRGLARCLLERRPTVPGRPDLPSVRDLGGTTFHIEFLCRGGIERVLGVESFSGHGFATLNLIRGPHQEDFTGRDRLVLSLLRPHFDAARRNAEQASAQASGRMKAIDALRLTGRELQIAGWLARAKTNREISIILDMQVRTVEKHVESILRKLHVGNRTAAAVILVEVGEPRVPIPV